MTYLNPLERYRNFQASNKIERSAFMNPVLVPVDPDTYAAVEIIEGRLAEVYGHAPTLGEWHRSPSIHAAKTYAGKLTRALEHLCRGGSIALEEIEGGMS